jgi:hypothetical protein
MLLTESKTLQLYRETVAIFKPRDQYFLLGSSWPSYVVFDLPRRHADLFDRQIIARALAEGIPVVTPDPKFGFYQGLKTLW